MGMSEHVRSLLAEMLKASAEEKREAAEELLASLAPVDEDGQPRLLYEEAWAAEIRRRLESGGPYIAGEEVRAETRAKLERLRATKAAKAR
jgi:hypothetical protein